MPIQYYYMVTNRGVVNKCGSIDSRSESSLCCHCHPVDGALDRRDPLICTISPNIFAEMNKEVMKSGFKLHRLHHQFIDGEVPRACIHKL